MRQSSELKILTRFIVQVMISWVVLLCSLVSEYHIFGGMYCLHFQVLSAVNFEFLIKVMVPILVI
jgi:hypothetical protein